MKTLEHQTLLYDEDCPLCNIYTSSFIKTKMLDANGRKSYGNISRDELNFIDLRRAANQIALVDNKNKTVIYGVDSLLTVLGHSVPWIKTIGNTTPVKFVLKKSYSFVSYNRKVIIPRKTNANKELQCIPDFNSTYRYLYILFAAIITSIILHKFSGILTLTSESNVLTESVIVLGQLVFQSVFILKLDAQKRLNYLGNLMTISLMGSLILSPTLVLSSIVTIPQTPLLIWFALTVCAMLYEHVRRVKLLELPSYLSVSWVIYRVILFLFILNY